MENELKLPLFWTKIVTWIFIVEEICVSLVFMLILLSLSNKMVDYMSIVTIEVTILWTVDIFPIWEVWQKRGSPCKFWCHALHVKLWYPTSKNFDPYLLISHHFIVDWSIWCTDKCTCKFVQKKSCQKQKYGHFNIWQTTLVSHLKFTLWNFEVDYFILW